MLDDILRRMRNKIRTGDYVMTLHCEEELDAEELTAFDIERCILTGEIIERQKDNETGEMKYRVFGSMVSGDLMEVVAKFGQAGRLFIITAYSI